MQPDSLQHETVEIRSQNLSDVLSCPHKSPDCAKHTGPVCHSQTLSTNPVPSLCTLLQLIRVNLLWLFWSKAKIKPDRWCFGCRHAKRNHWKIRGQPQSTLWLWPAAVTTAAVVCHEFPLLCCPAADLRGSVFILPNPARPGTDNTENKTILNHLQLLLQLIDCCWAIPLLLRKSILSNDSWSKGKWAPCTCLNISAWWSTP